MWRMKPPGIVGVSRTGYTSPNPKLKSSSARFAGQVVDAIEQFRPKIYVARITPETKPGNVEVIELRHTDCVTSARHPPVIWYPMVKSRCRRNYHPRAFLAGHVRIDDAGRDSAVGLGFVPPDWLLGPGLLRFTSASATYRTLVRKDDRQRQTDPRSSARMGVPVSVETRTRRIRRRRPRVERSRDSISTPLAQKRF